MSQATANPHESEPIETLRRLGRSRGSSDSVTDSFISLGVALAVAAVVVQATMHFVDVYVLDRQLNLINADDEANIPTWASASAAFVAATAALVLAVASEKRRAPYGLLAAVLGFMSLDDAVQVHERIVHERVNSFGPIDEAARVVWPLVYLPLLILGLVLLVVAARDVTARARASVFVGLGLLVAAVGLELAGTLLLELGATKTSFVYAVQVVVEEGLELAGWILIAVGLLAGAIERAAEGLRAAA
jgi:hypothetical protein